MNVSKILKDTFGYNIAVDLAPIEMKTARSEIVRQSCSWLLNNDFSTQNFAGRLMDEEFGSGVKELQNLDFKTRSSNMARMSSVLGWNVQEKNEISLESQDNTAKLIALMSCGTSAQISPNDISMNSFRFWDVIRLIIGKDHKTDADFSDTEIDNIEDFQQFYIRYKYFEFFAAQNAHVMEIPHDHFVYACFTMPMHQIVPVMVASFRKFERKLNQTQIKLSYPVLEPKVYSEGVIDDLLDHTYLKETVEWVKLIPLLYKFSDGKTILNSTQIMMPTNMNDTESQLSYTLWKYLSYAPSTNFSFIDNYKGFNDSFLEEIRQMFVSDTDMYLKSYTVTIRGYWLSEQDLGISLPDVFRNTVLPQIDNLLSRSLTAMNNDNSIGLKRTYDPNPSNLYQKVHDLIEESVSDIFSPALDYSSRLVLAARAIKNEGKTLPLFYSLDGSSKINFSNGGL